MKEDTGRRSFPSYLSTPPPDTGLAGNSTIAASHSQYVLARGRVIVIRAEGAGAFQVWQGSARVDKGKRMSSTRAPLPIVPNTSDAEGSSSHRCPSGSL